MRDRLLLDGTWQFVTDPDRLLGPDEMARLADDGRAFSIAVPSCWQAQIVEFRDYEGMAWYRRTFDLPERWSGGAIVLQFGAVDYHARVWINRHLVGQHEGGYTPFWFEIQSFVQPGENEVIVRVNDPPVKGSVSAEDYLFGEIPHGKQDWYTRVSGIWQSVWVEARGPVYVSRLHVTPDLDAASARLEAELVHLPHEVKDWQLVFSVEAPDSGRRWAETAALEPGMAVASAAFALGEVVPWEPQRPALYVAAAELRRGAELVDRVATTFGMRKIETRDNLIYLNNGPLYVTGALDQDYYPGTIYTPPSDEFLRDQFEKAKAMGLNLLRCHIKIPDPRYLDWADRVGLLIWEELPSWDLQLTKRNRTKIERTIDEMIDRDYNHPSIVIWTIVNEDWGVQVRTSADDREWVKQQYARVKRKDRTRLVVDNSPCSTPFGPSFHVQTDVQDYHNYFSIPDHQHRCVEWLQSFALNPAWTFSPYGDAVRTHEEPLIVSEFGNWGLPSLRRLRDYYGQEPWWFGEGWQDIAHIVPRGAEERFFEYRLDRVFGDFENFCLETQRHQFQALKFQIQEMRKRPSIAGYVITEFTDLNWEANGLLDLLRNPKVHFSDLASINAPDFILIDVPEVNVWSGQHFAADVIMSHFSQGEVRGATLYWSLAGHQIAGVVPDVQVPPASAAVVARIGFDVPHIESAEVQRLEVTLVGSDRRAICRNFEDLYLFPAEWARAAPDIVRPIGVDDPSDKYHLRERLEEAGYRTTDELEPSLPTAVITHVNARAARYLREGGRAVYLAHGSNPFVTVLDRTSPWDGDWVSNFNWLKRAPVFDRLPFEHMLGRAFTHVMPERVILGFGPEDADDVLGGMVVGWVHLPVAVLAQCRHGQGAVLVSTLDLEDDFGEDPMATILLHDMIRYTASAAFQPRKSVDHASAQQPRPPRIVLPSIRAAAQARAGRAQRGAGTSSATPAGRKRVAASR